jgi:tRNA-2-methylthio-N6-dimethylallyladenosine synthase
VRFKNNFIFKYSPRPGTTANDRLPDDVPESVKRWRNNDLLALQAEVSADVHRDYVGRTVEVFVERISERTETPSRVELGWERGNGRATRTQLSGRTGGDLITVFDAPDGVRAQDLPGRIVPVEVVGSGPLLLRGELRRSDLAASDPVEAARSGS